MAAAVGDLNATRPTPHDIHHDVKLCRGRHVIRPDRWERGSERLVQPDHAPVRYQDLSEGVECEVQPGALALIRSITSATRRFITLASCEVKAVIKSGRSQARRCHALVRPSQPGQRAPVTRGATEHPSTSE